MAETDRQERLKRLQQSFMADMPNRIDDIEQTWRQCLADVGHLPELLRLSHSLAGSAGTFGYAQISADAREIEQIVKQCGENGPSETDAQQVQRALDNMRQRCAQGPEKLLFQPAD